MKRENLQGIRMAPDEALGRPDGLEYDSPRKPARPDGRIPEPEMSAPSPSVELARVAALDRYAILDTEPEQAFDDLVVLGGAMSARRPSRCCRWWMTTGSGSSRRWVWRFARRRAKHRFARTPSSSRTCLSCRTRGTMRGFATIRWCWTNRTSASMLARL